MPTDNKAITVTYSNEKLRILVEEYITMQKHGFTFKSLCSYVLYRAMEEDKTANKGLYESNRLSSADCERISCILGKIVKEGRIMSESDFFSDDTKYIKVRE